jgi:transcriptional regulator with XRE-family HTH domain
VGQRGSPGAPEAELLRVSRPELRELLAAFRARLRPADVGLPRSARRRVPGLKREDVAELVGVSPNWYAAFEAGRTDHNFSRAFVQRVASVLRLDERERITLFRLIFPDVSEAAEHFESSQAASGRALAAAIYRELLAEESLREAQAATGRALANAIYHQLEARDAGETLPSSP